MKQAAESDSAEAKLLAFLSHFPWHQHTVRVSALDTLEEGLQTVLVGKFTKNNSISQTLVSPRCLDQAKNFGEWLPTAAVLVIIKCEKSN